MFDYFKTDSEYGPKLGIRFDYDEAVVARIKGLVWERTHRSWNGEAWTIDRTPEAIHDFEEAFGVTVPGEYRPGEEYDGTIRIVVPDGYTWFFIQNPTAKIDRLLDGELSYFQPGAEYTERYKGGMWDGYVHLYNTDNHGTSIGLLDRATALIEDLGFDVEVDDQGERTGDPIDVEWNFEHELRDYQFQALADAIDNEGGVISFPTGSGKTVVGMRLIHALGQRAIVFVHTKELLYQWADEIRKTLGIEPGLIGDGQWGEGPVTVAIMQTLVSRGTDDMENYGVSIFDECHRTSAAETMHEIGMNIDVEWRFGLSATPWRSVDGEELKIEGAVGGVASTVTAEQMIDDGYLAKPIFEILEPTDFGPQATASRDEDFQDAYRRCIEFDPTRNLAVATRAAQLADDGYKVLVNVDRINQGRLLEYALSSRTVDEAVEDCGSRLDEEYKEVMFRMCANQIKKGDYGAIFLSGSDDTETRQEVLEEFEDGDCNLLISTLLKEGVDIPSISAIVLAEGKKSDIAKIQTIGRALRPSEDHAMIVDVRDRGRYLGDHFTERQIAFSEYYGSYGPTVDEMAGTSDSEPSERRDLTREMSDDEEAQLAVDLGIAESKDAYFAAIND